MTETGTTPGAPANQPPSAPHAQTATTAPPWFKRRPTLVAAGGLTALAVAAGTVLGIGAAQDTTTVAGRAVSSSTSDVAFSQGLPAQGYSDQVGGGFGAGGFVPGSGSSGSGSSSNGSTGSGSSSTGSTTAATEATDTQIVGVVDITTELGYSDGAAAGTGMILTSDGEILTNNHVVEGATSITVTVLSTGTKYTATVVGTDSTDDVALLQLTDASGLTAVTLADAEVAVRDAVTAVGNAGGETDSTSAAAGTVTALDQSITATDESGANAEQLTGLIETDADVQAGDSGGPLFDADGQVVGIDTAASSSGAQQGYAIPIANAMAIVEQIRSGVDDDTIQQGYPAFLGVSVAADGTDGASIADVVADGPADTAGIVAGDTITAVGSTSVASADDLTDVLAGYDPGDSATITWTDSDGDAHTATVTLATGPVA